jgi:hypothetical protein
LPVGIARFAEALRDKLAVTQDDVLGRFDFVAGIRREGGLYSDFPPRLACRPFERIAQTRSVERSTQ